MMRIYHDDDGLILYTLTGSAEPPGQFIDVPDQDLGDLSAWQVADGALVRVSIEPLRAGARARLEAYMAAARAAYITVLPGQEMIYLSKEAEALAWVAAGAPDLADFPLLSAEAGITAPDADQLAQLWLNMGALWRAEAARLEALRMTLGAAIDAASTPDDLTTILQTLDS